MMCYTTAINAVFAFLIAGGIIFSKGGVTNELLLNLIFYIIDYSRYRYDTDKDYVYERGLNDSGQMQSAE